MLTSPPLNGTQRGRLDSKGLVGAGCVCYATAEDDRLNYALRIKNSQDQTLVLTEGPSECDCPSVQRFRLINNTEAFKI